jgi:A/G-specific adenine glycosylase
VVDTNVGRILARVAGRPLGAKEAQGAADDLVPAGGGWAWNQAVLDLGATVCAKRLPSCERCPVAAGCAWFTSGRPDPDPAVGSHAVSGGQSRFDGSFRQGRARLLDALRSGQTLAPETWLGACGWAEAGPTGSPGDACDGPRWARADARRAAETLVRDGLAVLTPDGDLTLPT